MPASPRKTPFLVCLCLIPEARVQPLPVSSLPQQLPSALWLGYLLLLGSLKLPRRRDTKPDWLKENTAFREYLLCAEDSHYTAEP